MDWDYANLSRMAKEAGGPQSFIDQIIRSAKDDERAEMMPLLAASFVVGSAFTVIVDKLVKHFKSIRTKGQQAEEEAKEEIIHGIEEYEKNQYRANSDIVPCHREEEK